MAVDPSVEQLPSTLTTQTENKITDKQIDINKDDRKEIVQTTTTNDPSPLRRSTKQRKLKTYIMVTLKALKNNNNNNGNSNANKIQKTRRKLSTIAENNIANNNINSIIPLNSQKDSNSQKTSQTQNQINFDRIDVQTDPKNPNSPTADTENPEKENTTLNETQNNSNQTVNASYIDESDDDRQNNDSNNQIDSQQLDSNTKKTNNINKAVALGSEINNDQPNDGENDQHSDDNNDQQSDDNNAQPTNNNNDPPDDDNDDSPEDDNDSDDNSTDSDFSNISDDFSNENILETKDNLEMQKNSYLCFINADSTVHSDIGKKLIEMGYLNKLKPNNTYKLGDIIKMGTSRKKVEDFVRKCISCQKKKLVRIKTKQPMVITDTSAQIWDKLALDIVVLNKTSANSYSYILTMQDDLSKFCFAIPLVTMTAKDIAEALVEHFICKFGCPKVILTDQGQAFIGKVMTCLAKTFKIKQIKSPHLDHKQTVVKKEVIKF
ncbi:uncharacterized protein DDB_G0287625-like [Cotesia glomerata]|uniref:uncharacterized protein DDB_G0287625-like n=1 Tax=Cotesia glomerata TaxID=32391 RepID=UPI001D022A8D|nr:uncharacterized protein DDB_G0287625-like [Cotesia glomerata]